MSVFLDVQRRTVRGGGNFRTLEIKNVCRTAGTFLLHQTPNNKKTLSIRHPRDRFGERARIFPVPNYDASITSKQTFRSWCKRVRGIEKGRQKRIVNNLIILCSRFMFQAWLFLSHCVHHDGCTRCSPPCVNYGSSSARLNIVF